jgi:hypothetical protein
MEIRFFVIINKKTNLKGWFFYFYRLEALAISGKDT